MRIALYLLGVLLHQTSTHTPSVQAILLALFVIAVLAVGYAVVSRLAYGFRV